MALGEVRVVHRVLSGAVPVTTVRRVIAATEPAVSMFESPQRLTATPTTAADSARRDHQAAYDQHSDRLRCQPHHVLVNVTFRFDDKR